MNTVTKHSELIIEASHPGLLLTLITKCNYGYI